ncbi:hypothetical protein QR680_014326 [Steinernema hermaphroditum]|uniref:Uncharacterized protein n=1 Tax=Steinernema hermaphroditum TaxID=289476 RepID=A0AA39I8I2_9BILA|nr:hypothetical protein QR680_014326 [Steinernema hermaphroditum]
MMFLPLALLALFPATDAYYYGHHYYDIDHPEKYFIQATYKVQTKAETSYAGSDAWIQFTYGYVNESTNELFNYYKDSPWFDGDGLRFDEGSLDEFTDTLEGSRYKYVEEGCHLEATTRDEYVTCLTRPNILFFHFIPKGGCPDWALDWVSVNITVNHKDDNDAWIEDLKGTSEFYAKDPWFIKKTVYFMRASENKERCAVSKATFRIADKYSKCH